MSGTRPTPGYREPGQRLLPEPTIVGGLSTGIVVPADKWFIRCTCSHQAYRDTAGVDEWTCDCGRRCHPPRQVAGPDGSPQLVWAPYRLKTFPAVLPPDSDAA